MKRKFLYGVLAAAGCLLNSCSDRQHDFDACGQIEATEVVVSAEANGRIVALNLTEGDELPGRNWLMSTGSWPRNMLI